MSKRQSIKKITKLMAALMASAIMFSSLTFSVNAESSGTITVDSAKVRSDASTSSDVVASVASGTTVTVTEEKTDSSGNVWYHVTLSDGKSGYIRSDLMNVTETADAAPADTQATEENTDAVADTGAAAGTGNVVNGIDVAAISLPEGVDAQDFQQATVSVATGKIRSDASTNDSIVAQLPNGTDLVIGGSKLGSDSKTWYYVAFVDNGSQQYGYIRSDLVSMGDVIVIAPPEAPVVEEEQVEAEPEPVVNNDYELVFTDDGTGNNVWYLYNHIDNTREKLQELLDYAEAQGNKQAANEAAIKKWKLIAIVLGVLFAIALVVIIILAVKSRSYDYEDYDDDDDDDDDYDDDDDDDDDDEEEYTRKSRRGRFGRRRYEDDEDEEDDDDEEEEYVAPAPKKRKPANAATSSAPRKPVTYTEEPKVAPREKKKPTNFMLDDDDFEFEFLNMDDK